MDTLYSLLMAPEKDDKPIASTGRRQVAHKPIRLVKYSLEPLGEGSDDAFLCSKEYYGAMLTCLQAVEKNNPAILADINPNLLRSSHGTARSRSHTTSSVLEKKSSPAIMIRRKSSQDRLAPPFISPSREESLMSTSGGHATPISVGSNSPDETSSMAKTALLQVLEKSGDSPEMETGNAELSHSLGSIHDVPHNLELQTSRHLLLNRARRHSLETIDNAALLSSSPTTTTRYRGRKRQLSLGDKPVQKSAPCDTNLKLGKFCDNSSNSNDNVHCDRPAVSIERITIVDNEETLDRLDSTPASGNQPTSAGVARYEETGPKRPAKTHVRSRSDFTFNKTVQKSPATWRSSNVEADASYSSSVPPPIRRHSMLEEGSHMVSPMSEYYFPRPRKGQSLRSFLSSQDFHTCADLDKENAHFTFSEAMIAAIEQIKCNEEQRPSPSTGSSSSPSVTGDEADEPQQQQQQQQRIRIRKQREKSKIKRTVSSTRLDSTAESFCSSESSGSPDSSDIEDSEINETSNESNLKTLKNTGLSLSLASLYSDADIQKSLTDSAKAGLDDGNNNGAVVTAETIAISLMKKFSDRQLPKASELVWLISEQEVPQQLLPLPNSTPVSPDDAQNNEQKSIKATRIRGNLEWAPPRSQIIFNVHLTIKRKEIMAKQNYFCAGCGCKIEPAYLKRYRYCEYLGKLFCQCCHTNSTAFIPGRILQKWDFNKYYVSNFARELLAKIDMDPLFNIADINASLYRKQKVLEYIRECRLQLFHIQGFLQICRAGQRLWEMLRNVPSHWLSDPDLYSINDLVKVKNGEFLPQLRNLVIEAVCHISDCQLCQAKGFICEICNNDKDLLFPFELSRVSQCQKCCACFHHMCYVAGKCPKCARIEARRKSMAASLPSTPENSESENDDDDESKGRCSTMIEVHSSSTDADDSSSPQDR
ncbi:run domain Beclin-1-interacting and cysteine-rich domain-containing protein-like isoform X2 [Tubulanus polymorphus]|uniref:run domain Beclin-1-interacting and cysteine-rich domain-containing protein-like isoform X2 n=1 Tax=Tubulanus polymorphus TaxID=672921 RepID=UPI003DA288D0